jgi:hypothetical protein
MRQRLSAAVSVFPTPGVWPTIWCVAAAAIYGCVPETDQMRAMGVLTVGCLLLELITRRQLGVVVHLAVAGVLLWAGLYGASGQDRAVVGALFAFWPAVIVPLIALVWPGLLVARPEPVRWVIAGLGAAAALIVARTGAIQPDVGSALRSVAIWGPVSLVAACVVVAVTTQSERRS